LRAILSRPKLLAKGASGNRGTLMIRRLLSVLLIAVIAISPTAEAVALLTETEQNGFNTLSTAFWWEQTTQADFETGVLNQVDTSSSPGDVKLAEPAEWYDTSWVYRKRISTDHTKVDDNLSNFPVLINLPSDPDLAAHAQGDGDDILFTSADGTTRLSHEIESFSAGTGQLIAWVKVPVLSSSTDTDIYMYYGNPGCGAQENATDVWDNSFKMVQHLDDSSASTEGISYFNDFETGVGFDYGSLNPSMTTGAAKNGVYGIRGNGDTAYKRACRQENSGRDVIFEAWVCPRSSSVTSLAAICFGQQTTGERYGYQCLIDQRNGGLMQIRKDYNSGSPLAQSSVPTILNDTWYWFRVIWESNGNITFELYDDTISLIDSISANDNTYTDGYYGVAAYQNADWDDFRAEGSGSGAVMRTEDSTSNDNDGIKTAANQPYETAGKIGNGQEFDGYNDYINCGSAASLQVDYITVEGWAKFDTNTGKRVIASIDDGSNRRWALYLLDGNPYVLRFFAFVDNSWASPDYPWQPTPDTWYYVVAVKSQNYVRTYINGEEVGTPQYHPGAMDKDPMILRIGVGNYPGFFDGTIDEVRISNIDRSTEWIKACYNNQSSPADFYVVWSETQIGTASGSIASQVLDTGEAGTEWSRLSWGEILESGSDITFEVRASDISFLKYATTPSWVAVGGTYPVTSGLPSGRYMQWRALLTTDDIGEIDVAPVLNYVIIVYLK
jgi:hypothetical protein